MFATMLFLLCCLMSTAEGMRLRPSAARLYVLRGGQLDDQLPLEEPISDVRVIEDAEDLTEALEEAGSRLLVLDFYAPWCGPCKKIGPILEMLATKHRPKPGNDSSGVLFYKCNVDDSREFAQEQGVKSMPTIMFFRNGEKVETIVGADIAALKAFIKRQTLHPLLRALSGERVVGGLVAAYLLWSYKETRSSTIGFA